MGEPNECPSTPTVSCKVKAKVGNARRNVRGWGNTERPHEALDMKCPQELYAPSQRTYKELPEVEHPFGTRVSPMS